MKTCEYCGSQYHVKPSRFNKSRYCSMACKGEAIRIHPKNDPRQCAICATLFKPSRHHGNARFCSKKCEWVARGGAAFSGKVGHDSAAKRGDLQRDRGEGKSYRKLNGRHEHRRVAEAMAGRPLAYEDVVHHRDGNKRNNDPANLEILTRAQHMREHGIGIPGERPIWMKR